jgi:hypothetical protein
MLGLWDACAAQKEGPVVVDVGGQGSTTVRRWEVPRRLVYRYEWCRNYDSGRVEAEAEAGWDGQDPKYVPMGVLGVTMMNVMRAVRVGAPLLDSKTATKIHATITFGTCPAPLALHLYL